MRDKRILNISDFRSQYPAFSSNVIYTDAMITNAFNSATFYLDNNTTKCLTLSKLTHLLYLLTAHILVIENKVKKGDTVGTVTNATIDKVSVTLLAPNANSDFKFWLNQTPYGQQYLALIKLCLVGGIYVGGTPEHLAYPKAR